MSSIDISSSSSSICMTSFALTILTIHQLPTFSLTLHPDHMNREMVRHTRDGRVGSTLLEPEFLESISDIGRDIYRSVRLSLSSSPSVQLYWHTIASYLICLTIGNHSEHTTSLSPPMWPCESIRSPAWTAWFAPWNMFDISLYIHFCLLAHTIRLIHDTITRPDRRR